MAPLSDPAIIPQLADYHPSLSPPEGDAPYRRAGKTKADLLARFRKRIETAKKFRKDEGYEATWKRLNELYRGKHFADGMTDEDRIAVNIAFSTVNVIVPSVAVNYPQISVNARQELLAPQAETVEAVINYWWRKYDWRTDVKDIVKDSLIYGHGWAKVGWHHETKQVPLTPQEQEDHFNQQRQEAATYAAERPDLAHELPTDEEIRANIPTHRAEAVKDCPFVERVSPLDMLVDPESTCPKDLKWIAQRIVAPLEEAQKNEQYNAAARRKLKPDASLNARWRDDEGKKKYDDDVKRVTLWEFYDLRNQFYCVFAQEGDGFLVEPTEFPYPYGQPFVYCGNYDVPDYFYDLGDLEMLEPLQAELNAVRSDMRNHRKRWQRAHIALEDKFSPEAKAALQSDADNRVVWIQGDEQLSEIIQPLQQLTLDPNMYNYSEQIEQDIETVSGVSDYQRGALSETRRTATEASIIQDASNARAADKLSQIEIFIREIADRVLAVAQLYLTGDQVARIVGPDGAAVWVPFDRTQIEGEYDFEVEAGSTQPKNEQFKRQQGMQLLTALQPFLPTGVINIQGLLTRVLRDGFGIKDPSDIVMAPLIDPMTGMPIQPGAQPAPPGDGSATGGTADGLTGSTPQDAIPPNILTQLQGQVGLNLENS